MAFKVPKGDIWWWSIIWLALGLFMLIAGGIKGDIVTACLGAVLATFAVLIWLDQKWIAPPMMILYAITFTFRVIALFTTEFTLLAGLKALLPLYFAYLLWEWYRSEPDFVPTRIVPGSSGTTSPFESGSADDRWSNPYQENRRDGQ